MQENFLQVEEETDKFAAELILLPTQTRNYTTCRYKEDPSVYL